MRPYTSMGPWNNSSRATGSSFASAVPDIQAMMGRAKALRDEADSKVFEFPGTLAEFEATLRRQGVLATGLNPATPLGFLPPGLEVREFNGKTYIGTAAGLNKLPWFNERIAAIGEVEGWVK